MSTRERIAGLGGLDGVREATLCGSGGDLVVSSRSQPSLDAVARELRTALNAIQNNVPDLGVPTIVTVEGEGGALHMAQTSDSILILSTTNDANLGAVKLEMREALQA